MLPSLSSVLRGRGELSELWIDCPTVRSIVPDAGNSSYRRFGIIDIFLEEQATDPSNLRSFSSIVSIEMSGGTHIENLMILEDKGNEKNRDHPHCHSTTGMRSRY